jgi:hypothetical protein
MKKHTERLALVALLVVMAVLCALIKRWSGVCE